MVKHGWNILKNQWLLNQKNKNKRKTDYSLKRKLSLMFYAIFISKLNLAGYNKNLQANAFHILISKEYSSYMCRDFKQFPKDIYNIMERKIFFHYTRINIYHVYKRGEKKKQKKNKENFPNH